MKKIKIKWINVSKAILLVLSSLVVIHDMFMVTAYGWITNKPCQLTWFGLGTFLIACYASIYLVDNLFGETKSASESENVRCTKNFEK